MSTDNHRTKKWLGAVALLGSALLVLFWTLTFTDQIHRGEDLVSAFESAFPVADTVLFFALVLAGVGLFRDRAYGVFSLAGAAAMTLYLGLLDLTFYVGNSLLTLDPDGLFQGLVITCCLAGGTAGLRYSWKMWAER